MLKDSFMKRILFTEAILTFLFLIAFGIASIYSWTLLLGFVVGVIACTISFLFNAFTAKIFLSKKREKKKAFFVGFIRSILQMIWYILWILVVIWVDSSVQGFSFGSGGAESILKPIHFITFIVGISMVGISIIVAQVPLFKNK